MRESLAFPGNRGINRFAAALDVMNLFYRCAADAVLFVHAGFVAFVLVGQALILLGGLLRWGWVRNLWFRGLHLACIGIVVVESWCGVVCPLTTWERSLRDLAGEATYQGDFIAHWVHQLLFYDASPTVFTVCYSVFGGLVLGSLWLVPPRRRVRP